MMIFSTFAAFFAAISGVSCHNQLTDSMDNGFSKVVLPSQIASNVDYYDDSNSLVGYFSFSSSDSSLYLNLDENYFLSQSDFFAKYDYTEIKLTSGSTPDISIIDYNVNSEYYDFYNNFSCNAVITPIYYDYDTYEIHTQTGNPSYSWANSQDNNIKRVVNVIDNQTYSCFAFRVEILPSEYLTSEFNNGYQSGYSDGYQSGKSDGITEGETTGYQEGFTDGSQSGYTTGYSTGYNQGVSDSSGDYGFMSLFATIADVPILMIRSMFNFDIFGTTMLSVVLSLFSLLIVIYLAKKLLLK